MYAELTKSKKCTKCNIVKSFSEFQKCKKAPDKMSWYCKPCIKSVISKYASSTKAYKEKNKHKIKKYMKRYSKAWRLRKFFGIKISDKNKMLKKQKYKCAICNKRETGTHNNKGFIQKRELCLDHCHVSGKIRGLLCNKCNRGLGFFNDCVPRLKKAVKYLVKNSKK